MQTSVFIDPLAVVTMCLSESHHSFVHSELWAPHLQRLVMGAIVELRKTIRYQLDLPVTFRWKDRHGRMQVGAGFTHDVSAVGMFLFSHDTPAENQLLHCEVKLPRLRDVGCVPVIVSGRVVRIEHGTDWRQQGFAVVGEMIQLCNELSPNEFEDEGFAPHATPLNRTN
jgi:hypothetical protein